MPWLDAQSCAQMNLLEQGWLEYRSLSALPLNLCQGVEGKAVVRLAGCLARCGKSRKGQ
jgi:hypothetical protein